MTLRLYLFALYLVAIVSAGLGAEIIISVNPFESPFWLIAILYISIFLFVTSIGGLFFFGLKVKASNHEVIFAHLVPTLRQSAFIALAVVGLLFLLQAGVLNWWVGALYVIAIILVELFFRGRRTLRFQR